MLLSKIFKGAPDIDIKQLSSDSRVPMKDAIFFCVQGFKFDGHEFINEAISNGAKVIVYEKELKDKHKAIYVKVPNVDDAIKKIGSKFYNYPQNNLETYIVNGCYGRSSVALFINHYLNTIKHCGYIGRFGIKYNDYSLSTTFPTLTSLDNLRYINSMVDNGIDSVTFEATSSSLGYNKLNVIDPDVFVYTNTYKDSQEFKENGNDYFNNIRHYLYSLEDKTTVVLNRDDISYDELKDLEINVVTYGVNQESDYLIKDIILGIKGSKFSLSHDGNVYTITTKLLGMQSIYNLTAAFVSLITKGYEANDIIETFKNVNYVEGTMEVIDDEYNIIVDGASSIDNLSEVFNFAKNVKDKGKVIGVIGISSTDDTNNIKATMSLCEKYLDLIILTEKNSYDMDTNNLLSNARSYLTTNNVVLFEHRKTAIENAIELLNKNDILLLLGMGYLKIMYKGLGKQVYNGDKEYALRYLNRRREEENEII